MHPLSHGQRALWFLHQLAPGSAAYNIVRAVRIVSDLDVPALARAFQRLVDRHAALRTTFTAREGQPLQHVHEHMDACFQVRDASGWSRGALNERLAEESVCPFDLERGPLMRVTLFEGAAAGPVLLVALHHIITDLWSQAILSFELGALYTEESGGPAAPLKPLAMQYTDHVRAQAELLAGPEGEALRWYWLEQLSGDLPALGLCTDRPRPPRQTYRGASASLRLSDGLAQGLRALSQAHGATLYATLLAAFQVLLHRYTGQEDILVGSPTAGRRPRLAGVVGYFVNPIVLRADLGGDPTFADFLRQVQATSQ
ncbi:MAG TPA: condensation domain-containing protein, partial [Anaerolineae bacterium]|nr:condensation domain-containing protein [Anaerolineae bacterium]